MAYTAGFSVSVGDPTKASNITTLAANDDFLKAAVDAIMTDSATPSASIKSTVVLADGVSATTQSNGDNSLKVATTAYADAQAISFSNDANNRVVTGTGSGINGEANLTFDGSTLVLSGDQTNYVASNGSDPTISLGTSSTNRLLITSDIASGSQELDTVTFSTVTAATAGDKGKFVFAVDETTIATIDDGGIDLASSKAFTINGAAVTTTPAGSDHQVQWNDSGSFGASANLTFDGSTLALSGDQTNYEDANDANNSISLGTSATERLEIKSMNASGTKTLEELRFTTKTASGTGDHAKMTFYMDDVERFKILDAGIQFGTGDAFTVDYDKFNITGSSNPPFEINTTNTKKLLLKDVDDSSLIFAEGSTERATITWSASGDSLTIYNEEESRGVRINTDFEYYNGSSWSSLTSGGGAYTGWSIKTTTYTASSGDQLIGNHSSTAFTITLPSSPTGGDTVIIKNVGASTITVGRNSQKINSQSEDGTLLQNAGVQLIYVDATIGWASL